jgi:hypothetical protein
VTITEIRSAGLLNGTPKGGWANEFWPEDCVHTLIAMFTDESITGWGSAFTNTESSFQPASTRSSTKPPTRSNSSLNHGCCGKHSGERWGSARGSV